MERLRDRPRVEIVLEREGLLEQRMRIAQRVLALSHAEATEVLATRAKLLHVTGREQSEAAVRTASSVRIHGVLRELTEVPDRRTKRVDLIRVRADAGHHRSIAGLHS